MGFKLDRVHVWSGEVADQAGGVAAKLSLLAQAGANLEYIYTRRQYDKPGAGVLYVAPVTGPLQLRAARSAGLSETNSPVVLRVEGDNQAGLGHRVTQQWALAGLSFQGLTMAVLGTKFVGYVAFDTVADANPAPPPSSATKARRARAASESRDKGTRGKWGQGARGWNRLPFQPPLVPLSPCPLVPLSSERWSWRTARAAL